MGIDTGPTVSRLSLRRLHPQLSGKHPVTSDRRSPQFAASERKPGKN
jgi:hypothetical protein